MQWQRNTGRRARTALAMLMGVVLGSTAVVQAVEPDDLAKQIEKLFSGVQRRIVTEPSRAEKEMLEARKMLAQLKEASPDYAKLPALQKRADDLAQKLEKRLGRPVGGSGEKEESKPAPEPAQPAPSSLPSSVTSRLKRIDAALSAVVTALEKNQMQTASRKLGEAQKLMDEIKTRYAKQIPADNQEMKAASDRLTAVGAKYTQADSAAKAAAAALAEAKQQKESQSGEWMSKFSPFFDIKGDQYLLIGAAFNRASEAEQEKCRKAFARANELMAAYKKTPFPHGKTMELTYLEQRLSGYLTIYNEGEARARQEESCRPWVDKLRAYVDVGAGSPKYLVDGVTVNEGEIQSRAALLKEAQALWPEYQKAEFPHGKTPQLLDLEERMQQRLKDMPELLRKSRVLVSGDLQKEFERVLSFLQQDTGWQDDPTKQPHIAMERDIKPLHEALERYAGTVSADDAQLARLRGILNQIVEQDQKNRAIRAERTYMLPDRYGGSDADDLRRKVEAIVTEKMPQAKKLRVTLPAEDWREENVIEWTDTTRTTLRLRNTRYMTTQIAAKGADGKVFLHSVHLASDRGTDGTWGSLYGHIMWSDWMAEANVSKEPPGNE